MQVITLMNEKGGVGKTTLATHLAGGLAAMGQRVILIDTDPQGQATMSMGIDPYPGIYDVLVRGRAWRDALMPVAPDIYAIDGQPCGMLGVVGSNEESRNIPGMMRDALLFGLRLSELAAAVDVCVIDTSPTPSLLHGSMLMATDYVLMPTQVEFYSLQGLQRTISHLESFRNQKLQLGIKQELQLLGIVPTMVRSNTIGHQQSYEELIEHYDVNVWDPIGLRVSWSDAALTRSMVWAFEPEGRAAADAWSFVERVRREAVGHEQTRPN